MKTDRSSTLRFLLNGTLWSFVGVLLTIAFFYWTEQRNPFSFVISLDDVQNLVEVRERIPDLKILYRDQDVLQLKRNIRIARITLRNDGATVLQQHYDAIEPFGLRFPASTVLDHDLVDSNSDYIKEHLLVDKTKDALMDHKAERQPDSQGSFTPLQKVIFEKGKYATIRFYLLQNEAGGDLAVQPVGKIANIDKLRITMPQPDRDGEKLAPFWVPFISAYFGVIVGVFSLALVILWFERSSRKRKVDAFVHKHEQLSSVQSEIISIYRDRWNTTLSQILRCCSIGDQVFDLREDIIAHIENLRGWRQFSFLNPFYLRSFLQPRSLPVEIFACNGTEVALNPDNKDFILRFFTSVGIIEHEDVKQVGIPMLMDDQKGT